MGYRDDLRRRPVRVGNMGTMDVNADDQLGPDETGEMMHRSDGVRVKQLQDDLKKQNRSRFAGATAKGERTKP